MNLHRKKPNTSRLFGLCVTALLAVSFGNLSLAAERGSSSTPQAVPSITPARSKASLDSATTIITKFRIGEHPKFTRVVLELTGPQEFSVEHVGSGVRILVPGVGLDGGIRRVDYARGPVRSVQPMRRAGGAEVLVVCDSSQAKIRTLTLTDPDRIVLDVFSPSSEEEAQASEIGRAHV
jgi:hypothetical protein